VQLSPGEEGDLQEENTYGGGGREDCVGRRKRLSAENAWTREKKMVGLRSGLQRGILLPRGFFSREGAFIFILGKRKGGVPVRGTWEPST